MPNYEPLMMRTTLLAPETGAQRITVESWPRETQIAQELLALADPSFVVRNGNEVTITVANGRAVYRLGEPSIIERAYSAYLVSSRLAED